MRHMRALMYFLGCGCSKPFFDDDVSRKEAEEDKKIDEENKV